jgi:hypothetical protein
VTYCRANTLDLWSDTNWFALQTKAHQENLAAAGVTQLHVDVFLPRV